MELAAYGLVQKQGSDAGIDSAGEAEHYLVGAYLLLQAGHGGFDEAGRSPVACATADAQHEVAQYLLAIFAVMHLRVELYSPDGFALDAEGCVIDLGGGCYHFIGFREGGDGVAVAHPHLALGSYFFHQGILTIFYAEDGAAILAAAGSGNHAAPLPREPLRTVAYSQYGKAGGYAAEVGLGSILGTDARRASG